MNKYIALDKIIKKQLSDWTDQQKTNLIYGFLLDKYNLLEDKDIVQFLELVCGEVVESLE
jgi:hypothetical protein